MVIEMEMVIEVLLISSVTAFHFSVVTGRPWPDPFVSNTQLVTGGIKRMNTIRLFGARITELTAVICWKGQRIVSEVANRTL